MKPKPWHFAVIVVGLILGVGSTVRVLMAETPAAVQRVIHCIDVESGDLYRIDTVRTPVILPARHPTTGRVCLVRISRDEHGTWIVRPRDRETLDMLDKDVKVTAIDPGSGSLLLEPREALEYTRAK